MARRTVGTRRRPQDQTPARKGRDITQATRGRKPEKKAGKPVTEKPKSKDNAELSDQGQGVVDRN